MIIIKIIKDFFLFIYNDLKADVITIKMIIKGKQKFKKPNELFNYKKFDFKIFLKNNWVNIIIILGYFLAGWFIASSYYQNRCNEYILNNYINNPKSQNYLLRNIQNLSLNFSFK